MSVFVNGYEILPQFLTHQQLNTIKHELKSTNFPVRAGGIRNAEKTFSCVRELADSDQLLAQARKYLPGLPSLVRGILFNKTVENNWLVTWHQDKTVAVSKRFEDQGWGPWSVKDDILHVQPPLHVLNQTVTFRIHLDDATESNGCLKVLPKSQLLGIIDHGTIQDYVGKHQPVTCAAPAGAVLVMRPHLLHSSSKAVTPSQRRVLHLEYSSFKLPAGVTWA